MVYSSYILTCANASTARMRASQCPVFTHTANSRSHPLRITCHSQTNTRTALTHPHRPCQPPSIMAEITRRA
eukprot:scaffold29153_cov107-Isochrysis_galbana.AAC.10